MFLNFLGTLAMLQDTVGATNKLQQIVNDCERFMDGEHDEWLRWLFCLMQTGDLVRPADILVDSARPEEFRIRCTED